MTATWVFEPLQLMVDVFNELYAEADCSIFWVESLHDETGAWGRTHFPSDDGSSTRVIIELDVECPIVGAVEVLAHELAHAKAGPDADHGPEWEAVFTILHAAYQSKVELMEGVAETHIISKQQGVPG